MNEPGSAERGITPYRPSDRADLAAFLSRARRVDESGVLRVHERPDARVGLWVRTGFDVLATRSIFGSVSPSDVICDAAVLSASLVAGDVLLDTGNPPTIAWQGALPGANGFSHLDDVSAREVLGLARAGRSVAQVESGALGPAASLLDQKVLTVSADTESAQVSMRAIFALTAMGFVRDADGHEVTAESPLEKIAEDEPVRVRVNGAWIRLDARFGSVYERRTSLSVGLL